MSQLHDLAVLMKVRVRRDECGDEFILGRRGNVHADGTGVSVALMMRSVRGLESALDRLKALGGQIRQRGDWEAVLHIPTLPNEAGALELRDVLRVKKVPEYAPEVLERKREAMEKARRILTTGTINGGISA